MIEISWLLGYLIFAVTAPSLDPAVSSPEYYRVVLDNAHVRVLELTLPPGAEDLPHSHPATLIYVQEGGRVKITAASGEKKRVELSAGQVFWQAPTVHQVKNRGRTVLKVVAFEIREPTLESPPAELDPATVASAENVERLENERVRLVETVTPPQGGGERHGHGPMVVYTVSPVHLEITSDEGVARQVSLPEGSAIWLEPVIHRVRNLGDAPSHLLHVEIK